jgi:hypothetical protein
VDLIAKLTIDASKLNLQHGFPMADSIILATALGVQRHNLDSGFGFQKGVKRVSDNSFLGQFSRSKSSKTSQDPKLIAPSPLTGWGEGEK